jgi:hypothetical protein
MVSTYGLRGEGFGGAVCNPMHCTKHRMYAGKFFSIFHNARNLHPFEQTRAY